MKYHQVAYEEAMKILWKSEISYEVISYEVMAMKKLWSGCEMAMNKPWKSYEKVILPMKYSLVFHRQSC